MLTIVIVNIPKLNPIRTMTIPGIYFFTTVIFWKFGFDNFK